MENIDWNDPASICDAVLNFESDDPNVNEAVDNIDHSDPTSFFRTMGAGQPGRMLMPEFADAKTVRRRSTIMSNQIFSDWTTLRQITDRHQATIQKRWAKKTKNQRTQILLSAWPNMASA